MGGAGVIGSVARLLFLAQALDLRIGSRSIYILSLATLSLNYSEEIPILHMKKLSPPKVKYLALGQRPSKRARL